MRDVRLAFRRLRTQPGYAVPALLILGLGLGTSVAMFSFVHGLLLRPIALPHLPRLVTLWSVPIDQPEARGTVSAAEFLDWLANARSIASAAAWQGTSADSSGDGFPERLGGARVLGDFFGTLGAQPLRGRLFGREANEPGNDAQVVLSESLWRRRYGGEEGILGQAAHDRWHRAFEVVARMAASASVASVEAELRVLSGRWAWQTPVEQPVRTVRVVPLADHLLAHSEAPGYLTVVLLAAGFLLALACANVANLQVAQMNSRLREFVVRAAPPAFIRSSCCATSEGQIP